MLLLQSTYSSDGWVDAPCRHTAGRLGFVLASHRVARLLLTVMSSDASLNFLFLSKALVNPRSEDS